MGVKSDRDIALAWIKSSSWESHDGRTDAIINSAYYSIKRWQRRAAVEKQISRKNFLICFHKWKKNVFCSCWWFLIWFYVVICILIYFTVVFNFVSCSESLMRDGWLYKLTEWSHEGKAKRMPYISWLHTFLQLCTLLEVLLMKILNK